MNILRTTEIRPDPIYRQKNQKIIISQKFGIFTANKSIFRIFVVQDLVYKLEFKFEMLLRMPVTPT